jgi:hypothetical protein
MTLDETIRRQMSARMSFIFDAVALREIRGWPNEPLYNAAIIYELHGWPFERRDIDMVKAEIKAELHRKKPWPEMTPANTQKLPKRSA